MDGMMRRLLDLQQLDTAIDRLSARRRALESGTELTAARAQADGAENVLGELGLQLDVLGRDQQRLEHEVDSLSQKAAAEEKRLYDGTIANTKELESLQREIENLKKRRTDREDELLVLMEQREGIEAQHTAAETTSGELRTGVERISTSGEAELAQIEAELATLASRRQELAALLDPELLQLYEDLRAQKKGVGAAALVDGVCQGCHEKLAAMELDKLKKTEGIPRCQHCRRILVMP
jgi:predicted  nucleic acid-binding Zn-ribbon protein